MKLSNCTMMLLDFDSLKYKHIRKFASVANVSSIQSIIVEQFFSKLSQFQAK